MKVLDYIAHETERQSGTVREALGMFDAWSGWVYREPGYITEAMILGAVRRINGQTHYRHHPVVFRNGGMSVNHTRVPAAMGRLIEAINDPSIGLTPEHYTREFLEIHPFADGNGRVGSLLWNFLRGTISDPEPMPYFFGEE